MFVATKERVVRYGDMTYRRYAHNGYSVLNPIINGVVDESKKIPEHRVVYELEHGVSLPDGIHIHHLNRNRMDNRPENLIALSVSDHARLHAFEDEAGYCNDEQEDVSLLPLDRISSIPKETLEKFVSIGGVVYYRSVSNSGYTVTPIIDGVPDTSGKMLEHRLVYEIEHDTKLDPNTRVFHVNGNVFDNRPSNLVATVRNECIVLKSAFKNRDGVESEDTMDCVITKDRLSELAETLNNKEIGEMYGVTGNAVAAWRKKLGVPSVMEQRRKSAVTAVGDIEKVEL